MNRRAEILRLLRLEMDELTRALKTLEDLQASRVRSPRGRKFMGQEERKIVSERMKRYWAGRRAK